MHRLSVDNQCIDSVLIDSVAQSRAGQFSFLFYHAMQYQRSTRELKPYLQEQNPSLLSNNRYLILLVLFDLQALKNQKPFKIATMLFRMENLLILLSKSWVDLALLTKLYFQY